MNPSRQPTLAELTSRSMAARAVSTPSAEDSGDVEPHEVLAGIRVDAKAAWADARLALELLGVPAGAEPAPADWSSFVDANSGRLGIPMAAGHFPQRLRDVAGLFAAELGDAPQAKLGGFAGLTAWIDRSRSSDTVGLNLLASGFSREMGHPAAQERGTTSAELNERAADLWCSGDPEAALAIWESIPAGAVISFNLGMANLMLGRTRIAQDHLRQAVASLPQTSGWNHLAALYLTVATIRS